MSRPHSVDAWTQVLSSHLPELSVPQVRVLAEWSFGLVLVGQWGLTTIAAALALLEHQSASTVRQRLREWYTEAQHKRGTQRRDVVVEGCFASLLRWVLAWWPPEERRLALALDATSVGARFTILSLSVLYRDCAIPVAWAVVHAQRKGVWRPHWERLVRRVGGVLPADWCVVVCADRGLYARWLFTALTAQGWHPFLRVNGQGTYHPAAGGCQRPLRSAVPTVGSAWCGEVVCFQEAERQLASTLVAGWAAPYKDPWLVLTDLAPGQAQVVWYGLRTWIEAGFKDLKRGGWHWPWTRIQSPERAARCWLVLAVATLWVVSVGGADEASQASQAPWEALAALPVTHRARQRPPGQPPRQLSVFRRGRLVVLVALLRQHVPPRGFFAPFPWPGDLAAPPPTPPRSPGNTRRKNLPL